MISLTLSPPSSVLARTLPSPFSAFQPSACDLANISSHQGKSRSCAMRRNQGVKELPVSQCAARRRMTKRTLIGEHLLQLGFGNVSRVRHLVVVELGIDVDGGEQNVVD